MSNRLNSKICKRRTGSKSSHCNKCNVSCQSDNLMRFNNCISTKFNPSKQRSTRVDSNCCWNNISNSSSFSSETSQQLHYVLSAFVGGKPRVCP
mmetsp:Transcript_38804/g.82456  ORF Transcript_38804/g.82456 Transcript_38804/m.82456 type:complete len:94 (+) Transcript_38804:1042-1323(+)